MQKIDILIIGAGPAGIVAATTAKKYYPDKSIMIIKSIEAGCIPCGIPYMFSSLKNPEDNQLKTKALEDKGINIFVDQVIVVNPEEKKLQLKAVKNIITKN